MHDLMEAETAIVGSAVLQRGRPDTEETNKRFPFLLELKDAYLIGGSSAGAEATASEPNDTDVVDLKQEVARIDLLVKVDAISPLKEILRVQALQRWTGRVEQVLADRFVAIVSDVTNPSNPDEEVELDIEDVPVGDRGLIAEGAIFYWAMFYRDSKAGQREKSESIRFARQPKLTEQDMQDIFDEADAITAILERA
jgi:hypothetical protein